MPEMREYATWTEGRLIDGSERFGIHQTGVFSDTDVAIATLKKKVIEELANKHEELKVSICLTSNLMNPIHTFKITTGKNGEKQVHYTDCNCDQCNTQPS